MGTLGTLLRVGARLALVLWLAPVRCYQRAIRALSTVLVGRIGRRDAVMDIATSHTWPMPAVLPTATRSGGSSQLVSARMTRSRLERPLLRESIAGQYADGTPIPPVVEERDIADYSTVRIQALPPSLPTPPPVAPRHTPVVRPSPSPNYQTYRPCLPVAVMTEQGILLRAIQERFPPLGDELSWN